LGGAVARPVTIPYNAAVMARRRKNTRPVAAADAPAPVDLSGRTTAAYLAALFVSVVVCFFPLLTYFFAQDDFTLMFKAWRDGWGAVADYFQHKPGMFRPLTKAAYFGAMHGLFGLNPTPFHAVSMVVHLANTVLVFVLMRQLALSRPAALVAATLFGLSVAFFHVIAWISCIQQLLGQLFMLSALVWGMEHAQGRPAGARWYSLAAYVLALLSAEQTFGVPVILVLYAWLKPSPAPERGGVRGALVAFAPHLAVMAVYLLFMGVWKTAPSEGGYAFAFGANVAVNLMTYMGWSLQFGASLPSWMQNSSVPWSVSHVFVLVLIVYQLARRRWRETAFGVTYFLVAVLPTLFLTGHTYFLHTYIPAVGVLYLIALFVDDLVDLSWLRTAAVRLSFLGVVLAAMTTVSFVMVRNNEKLTMFDTDNVQRSFVQRRASIAKNVYDDLNDMKPFDEHVEKVYLVYAREGGREEGLWNNDNVMAAMGWGSMLPLVYERPDLETVFKVMGDAVEGRELMNADVYFYDDIGNLFPMETQGQE
jgi:hypothetical protein